MLLLLLAVAVWFTLMWIQAIRKGGKFEAPSLFQLIVGFITDFLDTLGVGSFAVTTALYRMGISLQKFFRLAQQSMMVNCLNTQRGAYLANDSASANLHQLD